MTIETVDTGSVVGMYRNNAVVKSIIDWLNDRERDPRNSETKAGNLMGDLGYRGERFTLDQIRDALDRISKSGCGTYQPGRPVENSRITWHCSARELAAIVLEEVANAGTNGAVKGQTEEDEEMETHYFADMTATELQNMSEFLQIIAKSRGTNGA